MKRTLVAVDDKVIAEVLKETKTEGGLIVPQGIEKGPQLIGLVLSVGPEVVGVEVGDKIAFHSHGGQVLMFEDSKILKCLKLSEIYCVVNEEGE